MLIRHKRPRGVHTLRVLRQIGPLGLGLACIWLLLQQIDPTSFSQAPAALAGIAPWRWAVALAATALSFWALGHYDVVFHRFLNTNVPEPASVASGASAIAVSQVLGMGIITGALVRWRLLPQLNAAQSSKIAVAVAISFLLCLASLVGGAGLLWGQTILPFWLNGLLCASVLLGLSLCLIQPVLRVRGRRVHLPSVRAALRLLMLSAIDTAAAATVLFVLMPAGANVDWGLIYAVYLLALSAALLTGTPGGVGPFELTLLSCLPMIPEPQLLGTILAFRLVYYAIPAICTLPLLAFPNGGQAPKSPNPSPLISLKDTQNSYRAEHGVCRQNGARMNIISNTPLALLETAQTCTAMFDPLAPATSDMFQGLNDHAHSRDRWPMIYKATAHTALLARKANWQVMHIADEAVLNPLRFSPEGAAYRQLRRKLRQARTAGVEVTQMSPLPWADLARIDAEWQSAHGGARGVSVGQFAPEYLQDQLVYIAQRNGTITGFISLHASRHERCLDLMRFHHDAPAGTMHLLVHHAISQAAIAGCHRLSLAAMPITTSCHTSIWQRRLSAAQGDGLRQFKTSFAPQLQPLYALAPNRKALTLGLIDMALTIRGSQLKDFQYHHEKKLFARPCQT